MTKTKITREEALNFHLEPTPGKWEVSATVPMTTQRDLSLAYSPGVAVPCEEIAENPELVYDYTNKGNLVAVISNGTAVLGLGNLGALGSKPVMEGKSVLLLKSMGARHENCIVCDTKGVIYQGRTEGMNQWKSGHAVKTDLRTLEQAMVNADVFLGVSVKGAVTQDMVKSMADNPVIFAMANPDPEITPEEAHEVRPDAIVATGRSDYPNQVNNVLGFPYLFRGALDIHARAINDPMKIACAQALAELAREDVPDEVAVAYGRKLTFGRDYIIPTPFDPRLIHRIPPAVALAGMETGAARRPIVDMDGYEVSLQSRMDPTASILRGLNARARAAQARMIFAEGDDPRVLRAAVEYQRQGMGKALVVGRSADVKAKLEAAGLGDAVRELEVVNAANTQHLETYKELLYKRLQRKGFDRADVHRLAARDRHVFSALMLAHGHGDGLVTGATRKSAHVLNLINHVFDADADHGAVGVTALLHKGRIVLMADTLVHEWPDEEDLANIAERAAGVARHLGLEPRVAFVSFSTFGYPVSERAEKMHIAPRVLDKRGVDFEYEGEMTVDVALNAQAQAQYPFSRLSGPANILVVPARHSASISVKLMQEMAGATVIGPILSGVDKSIQICPSVATATDILNMAVLAACKVG
ncbi:MAG: NADP-dependent malic enzyme [Rhodobacteraceae bacterium]|nr:NADP-dependent malic enzyme [Paracoccaceae bacterium]